MKKLLVLLLLSPIAVSEPSDNTQKFLWGDKVTLLTFGLYRCEEILLADKNTSYSSYLRGSGVKARCHYSYSLDKIIVEITVQNLNGLYDSWTEDGFIAEVYKTGDMSLDMVLQGCQKLVKDYETLEYMLSDFTAIHPFANHFTNSGLINGAEGYEEDSKKHIIDLFKLVIRLETSDIQSGMKGYTCEADAKDKKYKLGAKAEEYNFSITKEDMAEFYGRLKI